MEWLNYHHLLYFWVVAKQGSITRASEDLRLAHPTISAQIHRLEDVLGVKLLRREGRRLVLTDAGRIAFRYADEIFTLGSEFIGAIRGQGTERPLRLVVGVTDVLAKSVVRQLLEPVFHLGVQVRLVCREDRSLDGFIAELAVHGLDLVLADEPAGAGLPIRLFNHVLGESGTTFFAASRLASGLRKRFPRSLNGAPFLLPGTNSAVRRVLEQWFDKQHVSPRIVAEVDDSALIKILGEGGFGVFAAPTVVEKEVCRRHEVKVIGRVDVIRQRFYAISAERRLQHPGVVAICEAARKEIFAAVQRPVPPRH